MSGRYTPEPWGICQRSGRRVPLSRLVADGQYPGLLVDPRWRDPRHPQELPYRLDDDVTIKRRTSPDFWNQAGAEVEVDLSNFGPLNVALFLQPVSNSPVVPLFFVVTPSDGDDHQLEVDGDDLQVNLS